MKQSAKIQFDEEVLVKPKYRALTNSEKEDRLIEGAGDYKIEGNLYDLWCCVAVSIVF